VVPESRKLRVTWAPSAVIYNTTQCISLRLRQRTCSDVRRLLSAENDVILSMCVKQLLGNDANWLLLRFSARILVSRQTTSGTAVTGVLVMVSSRSSDTHCDSSWVRSWVSRDEVDWLNREPEQSTVNFVSTSWPLIGEQLHPAGHSDLRAALTSSTVVLLTSPEPVFPRVGAASLTGPPRVYKFF